MKAMQMGLNRIAAPGLALDEFIGFAKSNGFTAIEIRNDLPGGALFDGMDPQEVRKISETQGISVLTINALQRFNDPEVFLDARESELREMITAAQAAGIQAVVMCPVNDASELRSREECLEDTVKALRRFGPLFAEAGVFGYVEPLGFSQCSLRFKQDAVYAIEHSGYSSWYRLVHDTFHHYLSGEQQVFPDSTGMVHISGMNPGRGRDDASDDDRVLVGETDVMGNVSQLRQLLEKGYDGYICFEPFSSEVQQTPAVTLGKQLQTSRKYIQMLLA